MSKPMHAPTPWKVEHVWSSGRPAIVIVDADHKPVDFGSLDNAMLAVLAVNEHHRQTEDFAVVDESRLTPMMRQYLALKQEVPEGSLLMFRLGDFYEMFMDDARRAAPLLGLCLTHRAGQPMCGVPVHAIDTYLAKCVRAGITVALAEQMDTGGTGRLIRREVTRIVTPGTEAAARRERADAELARAERHGYDTETCLANAAECGGL